MSGFLSGFTRHQWVKFELQHYAPPMRPYFVFCINMYVCVCVKHVCVCVSKPCANAKLWPLLRGLQIEVAEPSTVPTCDNARLLRRLPRV